MKRLAVTVLSLALLAAPFAAGAQTPAVPHRIGMLTLGVGPGTPIFDAFQQGLREHGYVEGQNVALEYRYAQGDVARLAVLATELVRLKVNVVVTESIVAALAARQATNTIPIVMAVGGDPVRAGLAASLARPGGNVTGLTVLAPELSAKRVQLLKEVVPKTTLVAVVWNPANPLGETYLRETEAAAQSLGLRVHRIEVRSAVDLDAAFRAVVDAHPNALLTVADGLLLDNRRRIVEFAMKSRLPVVSPDREFADAGGLMTYGPSLAANFRRAAGFVDKILKGAQPGNLPIEQPTKFELVINLKTAKTLGLTIPQSLLLRADEVIQ
jgi:putative ABC transport system substrate-binding protein